VRILILSPNQIARYNWGHQLFRNEIGRLHDVIYYGEGYDGWDPNLTVKEIIRKIYLSSAIPQIILTYGWRYSRSFRGFDDVRDIPHVHISVDYVEKKGRFPGTIDRQSGFFDYIKPDIVFGITSHAVDNLKKDKVCNRVYMLPFSVDTNFYKKIPDVIKVIDVLASFTVRDDVYPNRKRVLKLLKSMEDLETLSKKVIGLQLIKSINASKIIITSNNIYDSLSMRYTETLACGGFLLADKPDDFDRLGYVDGKHLVIYKDMKDLQGKIQYYLKYEKEREQIAIQGMKFVRKNHSCEVRAREFTSIIKRELF